MGHVPDNRGNHSHFENLVFINCVINIPFMFISIIGNTLVLAAILRTPSLRSPFMIFLCSLVVSDLLVGYIIQPLYITNELTENFLLKQVSSIMSYSVCGVSIAAMTAISIDRFLALHYHMRYSNLITTQRAKFISVFLWFNTILTSFLALWSMYIFLICAPVIVAILLIVSMYCYIRIYRIVLQHRFQIHAQQQAVASLDNNLSSNQESKNTALNTFIYYLAMILCYMPLFISLIALQIPNISYSEAWKFTDTVVFMNSAVNPVLYCWRHRELRKAVVKTARKVRC